MKALATTLGILILSIFVFNDSAAQKANYTTHKGWTIGVGGGYAYQKSDIANSRGFGLDFTIGSQLYQKENAFLSVDWKFRFLGGRNTAYDHRINPDDSYSNIRYRFFTYDLELGLTLNRLRERTGIVLTGFAGIGLTHGHTFSDLYDATGNMYDFSGIDPNRDSKLVYEDLVALSDGDFETSHVNKIAILPTAGLFLGYQLSSSLTIGVEYKSNFYLTEDNGLFGIILDNKAISGSGIDRNNYVSLGLRWRFRGGASQRGASTSYSYDVNNTYSNTTGTSTNVVAVSSPHPSVHITDPSTDTYHSVSPNHTIRATINNVSGPDNISFSRNGYPVNTFTYNVNTKIFIANVRLREGENNFRIQAANQNSTAEDQVDITLDAPPEEVLPAPTVAITSPSGEQYTSTADWVEVSASVKNIISKEDIQLTLNGSNAPFEFYPYSGLLTTSVIRTGEPNNLLIQASNESGSAQDQLTVYFSDPALVAPPSVRFIDPLYPIEVRNERFPLNAQTQNVFSWQDIDLIINGLRVDNFSFNADGMVSVNLLLYKGLNTIEILARNEAGMASDRTSISYLEPVYYEPVYIEPVHREPVNREPAVRSYPPAIHIITPSSYPFRTYEQYEELHATVLNVHSKENIILSVNGSVTRNFNFNNSTSEINVSVPLREGENVLTIRAQNESGEALKDQVFIKETRPCPLPQIRLIDPAEGQINTTQQTYALRAEVRNITNSKQLRLSVNGKTVAYSLNNNLISSSVPLVRGLNSLALNAVNECGEDNASTRITYKPIVVRVPCTPPTVSFNLTETGRKDATHELRGSVTGVKNKSDISLTLNGEANKGFQFVPSTGELNAKFKLTPGSHNFVVSVNNACGTDNQGTTVTVKDPCTPPMVSFKLTEVNRKDATHELMGSVSGVKNKADISLTINGQANNGFQFIPTSGELNAKFKLTPGSHTITVTASNECGTNTKSESVTVKVEDEDEDEDEEEQEACGIRINPGNSDWQFCLVTPSGTFSRESLTNSNFSYSGSASSLFFKPIGGGGEAMVNGQAYAITSGQYYLFSGSLNVSVSTKHPGAMGHWSVCITANRAPVSGNGNNRPKSPCEVENSESEKGNSNNNGKDNSNNKNNNKSNNGSNDNANNGSTKSTNAGSGTNGSSTNTNTRTNRGSANRTIYRPGNGSSNRTNTVSNSRSKDVSNSKTVTRTNYRSDDKTKSTNRTTTKSAGTSKDTTNTRTSDRSKDRTTSRTNTKNRR